MMSTWTLFSLSRSFTFCKSPSSTALKYSSVSVAAAFSAILLAFAVRRKEKNAAAPTIPRGPPHPPIQVMRRCLSSVIGREAVNLQLSLLTVHAASPVNTPQ